MNIWLKKVKLVNDPFITELKLNAALSKDFSVNLFIKRDDNYPKFGGGNKARKLDHILAEALEDGCNAVVTAGGNQSNHVRATALYAASLGWKSIMIIHDKKPEQFTGNLKLASLAGSEIRHVEMANVKEAMDAAITNLKAQNYNPLYIWGGGHCLQGTFAYYKAVVELKEQLQDIEPDFIIVPSGTGTTQAGIEVGIRRFFPECKVLGVSVARDEKRGKKVIKESMVELNEFLNRPIKIPEEIFFDTTINGTGYESTTPELIEFTKKIISKGLVIDPTYTGKAFFAMAKFIEKGIIPPRSNVVFWHTGGIFNLLASNNI